MRAFIPLQLLSLVLLCAVTLSAQSLPSRARRENFSLTLTQTFNNSELVSNLPFSVHGLLAVRTDDAIQLWDLQTRKVAATLPGNDKTRRLYFSDDGNTFITTVREKKSDVTKLWDAQSGRLKCVLRGTILFGPGGTPDSQTVITLDGKQLKFWNAETGALQNTVTAYRRSFTNSLLSPDGKLVVRYWGKKAYLWEARTGKLRAELEPPGPTGYAVPWWLNMIAGPTVETTVFYPEFSPDSEIVATSDSLNRIELWDAATGHLRALLEGHRSTIYDLRFSADGQFLASASRDGTAMLWDVKNGVPRTTFQAGKEIARRVVFSPDGALLAVGYHTQARIWDISGQLRTTLGKHSDVNKAVIFGTYWDAIEIVLSPRGDLLLSLGDKVVNLWDVNTGRLVQSFPDARRTAAFSPDGKLLVTRGRDHILQLWNIDKN